MQFLIVDDNPANGKALATMINKLGSGDSVLVENISEALFLAFSQKWRAVFLDILMPGYNGDDFLNICDTLYDRRHLGKDFKVVVVTGVDSLDVLNHYAAKPYVSSVISKPIRQEDVLQALDML